MGATTTITKLIAKTRRFGDFVTGGSTQPVYADSDIAEVLNDCISNYYEMLVKCRGQEYFLTTTSAGLSGGNIVPGTATYTLPADFLELSSLTLEWNTITHELMRPLDNTTHIQLFANLGNVWAIGSPKGFRLGGTQAGAQTLTIFPTPGNAPPITTLRYIPIFTPLAFPDLGTLLFMVNGFDKLISIAAAVDLRIAKQLPVADLERKLAAEVQRFEELATERMANFPDRVLDVGPENAVNDDPWPPRKFM